MVRRMLVFLFAAAFLVSLSGCATGRKQAEMENQGLKNQVSLLESQIQSKDEEINGLREALSKAESEKEAPAKVSFKGKMAREIKSRPKPKQIQIALKNAGFYDGPIDGHIGKQTTQAIRDFQKSNSLVVDGKVGKRTWILLREHLEQKIK